MAVTVSNELLGEGVNVVEENGIVNELRYSVLVEGLSTGASDWRKLTEALAATALPSFGDNPSSTNTNLILTARLPRIHPDDNTKAVIDLTYTPRGLATLQPLGRFTFRGAGSVSQISTPVDIFGDQIVTQYTYSTGKTPHDWPKLHNESSGSTFSLVGSTQQQGGNINVMSPQAALTAQGLLAVSYPRNIEQQWTGYINNDWWYGGAPGTWLCSNVSYEEADIDAIPTRWIFTFEFQYEFFGWKEKAFYEDQKSGIIPTDLVSDVGIVTPNWYCERAFNWLFALP